MKPGDIVLDKTYFPDYPKELAVVLGKSGWPHAIESWDVLVDGEVQRRWGQDLEATSEGR